ncbi:hypothetical protein [Pseudomonas flexibilis]|uniref:Transmembrane protein n=1 Tax=Pseudomonas flexibilis TaxID=706570 RepID=A0A1N6YKD3_9PSED|nr:hypothetical protein [Pseudomonas flexibilis]KHL70622.1 hypothetical protein SF06_07060 [Pseudomonas flexibilis]SCY44702.1 hypothetical protein SAMN02927929_02795 [Pseudomonas flexibilis]SIR15037.1 hypothetical protein SAMN05421672_115104 [Pseudomonas flexibilis]
MSSTRPFAIGEASARYGGLVLGLLVWVLACGVLRFFFLEDERWLGWCAEAPSSLACRARGWLGWAIHLRVLAWLALPPALLGFCLPGVPGRWLAGLALVPALGGLVLYAVTPASFATLLALLRLVRDERLSDARTRG